MGASTNVAPVIIKRKKVIVAGGHHGGAWKVAYADFVTAMMAFFMLMWLLNATTENQRKGLADYFAPTIPVNRISGGGDGALGGDSMFAEDVLPFDGTGATMRKPTEANMARGATGLDSTGVGDDAEQLLDSIQDALMAHSGESMNAEELMRHIVTRVSDEGLSVEIFSTDRAPLFEQGSDAPTLLMQELVQMIARVSGLVENDVALAGYIRAHPIVLAKNPVWDLSSARASQLRQMLGSGGMDPKRIRRVTGHADRKPATVNPMASRNDRVEVVFLRN